MKTTLMRLTLHIAEAEGVTDEPWTPVIFARTLLPLVQLPPAGFWRDSRRPSLVVDPRPLPQPVEAATLVLSRYLAAFGPASPRDVAAWAGVAQRDFGEAWARLSTVSYLDETGTELFDLPDGPLPPASTPEGGGELRRGGHVLRPEGADRERVAKCCDLRPLYGRNLQQFGQRVRVGA